MSKAKQLLEQFRKLRLMRENFSQSEIDTYFDNLKISGGYVTASTNIEKMNKYLERINNDSSLYKQEINSIEGDLAILYHDVASGCRVKIKQLINELDYPEKDKYFILKTIMGEANYGDGMKSLGNVGFKDYKTKDNASLQKIKSKYPELLDYIEFAAYQAFLEFSNTVFTTLFSISPIAGRVPKDRPFIYYR